MSEPQFSDFLLDVIKNAAATGSMSQVETQIFPRADGYPQTVRIIVIPETARFSWP